MDILFVGLNYICKVKILGLLLSLNDPVCAGAEDSGDPNAVPQLEVSPASPITEGESFSIYLNFSAGHCQGGQPLHCGWTRNGSSLCSHDNERYSYDCWGCYQPSLLWHFQEVLNDPRQLK